MGSNKICTLVLLASSFFVVVLGQTGSYTGSTSQYIPSLLIPYINFVDAFDGPSSVAQASSTTNNTTPSLSDLMYYNYFVASMYCPYELQNLSCQYCANFAPSVSTYTVLVNSDYDTFALITVHPSKQEIVVTYRGSVALMNWIMDGILTPVSYPGGYKMHQGFYLCTMSLYSKVVSVLQTQTGLNPNFRVVIVGHSLGAAMASITTFFFKQTNQFPNTNLTLITYGQPRTGNRVYADYMMHLGIPMARVVARGDIIPHLPPVSLFELQSTVLAMNYMHHAREVWINGTQTKFCTTTEYEGSDCSDSLGPAYTIIDHLQYFDANYAICYLFGDPADINLVSVPGVLIPTDVIPPFPTFIQATGNNITNVVYNIISPILGR